ncbi:hypothetical protein MUK42_29765 [Musa troglodytarum]|uniref:Uncharacterized protein n=1 Tax=Musa troglodytarum TaxID=320322 RepID=A0A9E7FKT4_9LILI|nr:hypothetical protein MUK42_29765 [Musa troglodytarum]
MRPSWAQGTLVYDVMWLALREPYLERPPRFLWRDSASDVQNRGKLGHRGRGSGMRRPPGLASGRHVCRCRVGPRQGRTRLGPGVGRCPEADGTAGPRCRAADLHALTQLLHPVPVDPWPSKSRASPINWPSRCPQRSSFHLRLASLELSSFLPPPLLLVTRLRL